MTLKNLVQPDHASSNKYELSVLGLPKIIFTKVTGLEQETKKTTLPDGTAASGGETDPFEIVAELPIHHEAEVQAMEEWNQEGKDPVTLTYKKPGTMVHNRISGAVAKAYALIGMWPSKLKYPDSDMSDSETMQVLEVTFTVDDKDPL